MYVLMKASLRSAQEVLATCIYIWIRQMHKIFENGRRDFGYKLIFLFLYPKSISKVNPARPNPTMTLFEAYISNSIIRSLTQLLNVMHMVVKLNKSYEYIPQILRKLIQTYSAGSKALWYFYLYVFVLLCFTQFTLFVYKSLIIVVGIFQKYHWLQHKKTQSVVVTRERNEFI